MNTTYEPREDSDREPRELAQEAGAIRDDIERTATELEQRLSPQELLDRSLSYVQENGGELLQKVGAAVSKNPLPLLMTSVGIIWLLASTRTSSPRRGRPPSSMAPRRGDFSSNSQSFGPMKGKARELKQKAERTLDTARSRAADTLDATRERAHQYGDSVGNFVSDQPVACGAIALALGAVVGASFPASAYERDLVARAREAGKHLMDSDAEDAGPDSSIPSGSSTSSVSH
jgi:ElaB/YqjD/DUF883 family membrane-anchored ribosome-binding protein